MICSGVDVETGESVVVEFDEIIREIRPARPEESVSDVWIAPGFVDIQVNGFAGVDFNNPEAPVSDISRALDAILATGATRCLPTVITGAPADMTACLLNLER